MPTFPEATNAYGLRVLALAADAQKLTSTLSRSSRKEGKLGHDGRSMGDVLDGLRTTSTKVQFLAGRSLAAKALFARAVSFGAKMRLIALDKKAPSHEGLPLKDQHRRGMRCASARRTTGLAR